MLWKKKEIFENEPVRIECNDLKSFSLAISIGVTESQFGVIKQLGFESNSVTTSDRPLSTAACNGVSPFL